MKTSTTNVKTAPAKPPRKAKKGSVGKRIFTLYAVLIVAAAVALFAFDSDTDYELYVYSHSYTSYYGYAIAMSTPPRHI